MKPLSQKVIKILLVFVLLFSLGFGIGLILEKFQIVEAATIIKIGNDFDMQNSYFLKNLPEPIQNQDVATKNYVDTR